MQLRRLSKVVVLSSITLLLTNCAIRRQDGLSGTVVSSMPDGQKCLSQHIQKKLRKGGLFIFKCKKQPDSTLDLQLAQEIGVKVVTLRALHHLHVSRLSVLSQLDLPARETPNVPGDVYIYDISSLQGLPLQDLDLHHSHVTDLTPLHGMKLKKLNLDDTPVSDLSPLCGMPLEELRINGSKVTDLTPLRGMPLKSLDIGYTKVSDLTPISGMPLIVLQIGDTKVSDLAPLKGMPLLFLTISGSAVVDLSPLSGSPIKHLFLFDTKVTDVTPLVGLPLEELTVSVGWVRNTMSVLQTCKSLKFINWKTAQQFWRDFGGQNDYMFGDW